MAFQIRDAGDLLSARKRGFGFDGDVYVLEALADFFLAEDFVAPEAVGSQVKSAVEAVPGFDVVILSRGDGLQPGPEVLDAPGHVGFFAGFVPAPDGRHLVQVLAGNQGNQVSIQNFPAERILGIRRVG